MTQEIDSKCKIILENVPNTIDLDTIALIFENYKYCGECDLVNKLEMNPTAIDRQVVIEYSNESGAKNVLNCKNVISYKNYIFKPKEFKLTRNSTTAKLDEMDFSYDVESFKYPFYLLKTNKNLFDLFKSNLKNEFNTSVFIKNDATFTLIKDKNCVVTNEEWLDKLKAYLNHFKRTNFASKQWSNLEAEKWYSLREKAISNYGNLKDIYLIIKNEPKDYWIRIEGIKYIVEKAEQELDDEIASVSTNTSRKKMRMSSSINNFNQQK